jgi:hypothetical protein
MEKYKGKAKCSCGGRAKYRVIGYSVNYFACESHKDKLNKIQPAVVDSKLTEADYITWFKL